MKKAHVYTPYARCSYITWKTQPSTEQYISYSLHISVQVKKHPTEKLSDHDQVTHLNLRLKKKCSEEQIQNKPSTTVQISVCKRQRFADMT